MHAPLLFFDSTPSGRVLNRLSKDVDSLDNMIPWQLKLVLVALADLAAIVLVVSVSTPFFLLLAVPIAAAFVAIQRFYVPTSRQLRRLEANARSPLISHFSESIQGISISSYSYSYEYTLASSSLCYSFTLKTQRSRLHLIF